MPPPPAVPQSSVSVSSPGVDLPSVGPTVTAVVLAYGPEPLIGECVASLLASVDVSADVVLVDNGCTTDAVEQLPDDERLTILRPGVNTGFAGGCNLGATHASGQVVAFVNGDAVVARDALARLAAGVEDRTVGLATASLRLHDRPDIMNSAGNPVHFLGLSWAGGLGDRAQDHAVASEVASVSGAAFAVRRETWHLLGGFWEDMFAYCEDAELSLRTWQQGLRVLYVPDAVVRHRYEFTRNPLKMYLLERNRVLVLLTLYERRTLWLLAPALLGLEAAVLLVAVRQGWARDKLRGWWWIITHQSSVRRRRSEVQAARVVPDRTVARRLTGDFTPGRETGFRAPTAVRAGARLYWRVSRRFLA